MGGPRFANSSRLSDPGEPFENQRGPSAWPGLLWFKLIVRANPGPGQFTGPQTVSAHRNTLELEQVLCGHGRMTSDELGYYFRFLNLHILLGAVHRRKRYLGYEAGASQRQLSHFGCGPGE